MGARLLVFVKNINLPRESPDAEMVNPLRWQPGQVVDVFPSGHAMGRLDWASDRFKVVDTDMTFAEAQGLMMQSRDFANIQGVRRREIELDLDALDAGVGRDLTEPITISKEDLRNSKRLAS